jgi:hypothetical protein
LKKNKKWSWGQEQVESFCLLCVALTEEPLLQFPDFTKPFILKTDASGFAIGAILFQGKRGENKPILFASRTLNSAKQRYSVVERESLALTWAFRHYRPYLIGRTCVILTDHKPLTWLFRAKDPNFQIIKMASFVGRV